VQCVCPVEEVLVSGRKHHIHANIQKIGANTRKLFETAGFWLDPFIEVENSYAPPIHYAFECDDTSEAQAAWADAVKITQSDAEFEGYIEFETLSSRFEARLSRAPYNPDRPFPLPRLPISEVPLNKHKGADLHVKRAAVVSRDQLDIDMLDAGFYEVQTERNRIYTLQCEDARDAKRLFNLLRQYLSVAGGADQVNFEVISKFLRKPKDLHLPRYMPRQGAQYFEGLTQ
jgi:hypothetical protein